MKVAFSKLNITPKEYKNKPLAGYTRKNPCLGKLDDIYVHSVLIESKSVASNKDFLLLISLDLLKVPLSITKYIRNKIIKKYPSLKFEQILVHATHTHAAFDLTGEFYWPGGTLNVMKGIMFGANRNDKYIVWFTNKILKMVEGLFNNLKSCKIAWKKEPFNPDIVINRRHPSRKTFPHLGVISFKSLEENELLGFIINYACHPTTLSYKNNKLSADYPGRIIQKIKELTNNKVKAIYFNGASGDLNPITTCGTEYEQFELDKTPIYDQLGTYHHTERIGYTIAEEALKLTNSISDNDYFSAIEFQIYTHEFWIPMKDHKYFSNQWFTNKLIYAIKKLFLLNIARYTMLNSNFPIFVVDKKKGKFRCNTVIQYIKVRAKSKSKKKEFSLMTIPGELFEEIGESLLKASLTGKDNIFIFQNAQDWIGYLFPLHEYVEEGGYEPIPSFSPLGGYFVKNEMLRLLKKISNDIK
jgi:hypothetical protein